MQILIDNSSNKAVYQQIIDQIMKDVALGRLKPGDKLPTVRQLAADIVINPNTIAKAYKILEQQGVIQTRPGAGAFVATIKSNLSLEYRKKEVASEIEAAIIKAVHMKLKREDLEVIFKEEADKFVF